MDLLIDAFLTNVLQLGRLSGFSCNKSRSRVLVAGSVRKIGLLGSSVVNWGNHVVSSDESVDFGVNTTFSNVLLVLRSEETNSGEASGLRVNITGSVRKIRFISSLTRDWENHVVG
jgi:hypothetical protein